MKVSVVTVCYNAINVIEKTILSVLSQDYSDFEYIIIDGGSTDGTIDVIRKYEDRLVYWISEPDNGVYYAMNKGINAASGEWINFMNAGDEFVDSHTLSKFGEINLPDSVFYVYADNLRQKNDEYHKAFPISHISKRIICCHQSAFVSTKIKDEIFFDTDLRICADYNQQLAIYAQYGKSAFYYMPIPIARYDNIYGISSKAKLKATKEYFKIHVRYGKYMSCIWDSLVFVKLLIDRFFRSV